MGKGKTPLPSPGSFGSLNKHISRRQVGNIKSHLIICRGSEVIERLVEVSEAFEARAEGRCLGFELSRSSPALQMGGKKLPLIIFPIPVSLGSPRAVAEASPEPEANIALAHNNLHATEAHFVGACSAPHSIHLFLFK